MKKLTYEEIVEATGVVNVEELENIEILFTTCDRIGGMSKCSRLKRLSMIDNGMKVIAGLEPVRMTLLSLCLCDQEIVKLERLDLPYLRELFLHRNRISDMTGLSQCPRLTKLWLFQNNIRTICDLNQLTELEECWLQANKISKLDGIEYNHNLVYLGLAGNPVSEHAEFLKLRGLSNLQELSLNDIHFGKCEVVVDQSTETKGSIGYKDFIMCHLPQVQLLDGIEISKAHQQAAESNYDMLVKNFNSQLSEIEDCYRREMQTIDSKRQSSIAHNRTLEKEIGSSLKDLEEIVRGGRKAVDGEIVRQKSLLEGNYTTLETNIHKIYTKSIDVVNQLIAPALNCEYSLIEALFYILELIAVADSQVTTCLVDCYNHCRATSKANNSTTSSVSFAFSLLSENTVDFQYMCNILNSSRCSKQPYDAYVPHSLVLMKQYRLCLNTSQSLDVDLSSRNKSNVRTYVVVTPDLLNKIIKGSCQSVTNTGGNLLWCTDPEMAMAMAAFPPYTNSFTVEADLNTNAPAADVNSDHWSILHEVQKANVVLLLSCQLNISAMEGKWKHSKEKLMVASDVTKRMAIVEKLRKISTASSGMRIEVAMEQISSSNGQGNDQGCYIYLTPTDGQLSLISLEFLSICVTPMSAIIHLGSENSTLQTLETEQHGVRLLENKLELLLSSQATHINREDSSHSMPSIPELLIQFEKEVNYECLKYQEDLVEELHSEQGEQLRRIDYQLYAKENDIRKVRGEIEMERKTQDVLLRDLRLQVQQQSSDSVSNINTNSVRSSQTIKSKGK